MTDVYLFSTSVGLLIGPRGNTLKKMENESGAKIAIRGKGSVKEGKGKSDAAHASNQDEDLHCLIMADTEEKVNKAKKLIHNVIETVSTLPRLNDTILTLMQAASIPEGQNELKRNQLRELAALNGTLRDDENQACQNCGEIGHRKYDCPQARNYTANIICRVCGNAGHMARDCPDRQRGQDWRNMPPRRPQIGAGPEDDYERLMNELSGNGGGETRAIGWDAQPPSGPAGQQNGASSLPPWQRQDSGSQAPWQRPQAQPGGPAPWAARGNAGNDNGYSGGGYNQYNQSGYGGSGAAPWAQQSRGGNAGGAPWAQQQQGGYGGGYSGNAPWQRSAVPPPPGDDVPPPPPSDIPPPPPPA